MKILPPVLIAGIVGLILCACPQLGPTGLSGLAPATTSACTGAALARPRAFWAADVFGWRKVADLNVALEQRNSGKQYPHTTRIVAPSGDAEGPHTARDPV